MTPLADLQVIWTVYGAPLLADLKQAGDVLWNDRVAVLLFLIWFRLDRIIALLKQIAAKP